MKAFYTLILTLLACSAFAQSKLPPCEGDDYEQWSSCTGTIENDDGSGYEGDFADGQINGYGLLTLVTGEKILGKFTNSVLSGRGLLVTKDGSRYAGEFDQNTFNGLGILVPANGERIEGIFRNGQFVEAKKVIDPQIITLLAAPPVLASATVLIGKATSAEHEKTISKNQSVKSNQRSVANESLSKLDVLLFANSTKCDEFPYRIVKDLNGKTVLNHMNKNIPININVGALTSEQFTVWPNEFGNREVENRSKEL